MRGLRYLDLSQNRLTDEKCATLVLAAMAGPLEALELGGNVAFRVVKLLEAMACFSPDNLKLYPLSCLRFWACCRAISLPMLSSPSCNV